MGNEQPEHVGLHHRLRVLRRRKWILAQAVVLVPLAAVLYSLHQPAKYRGAADVLLGRQSTVASLSGSPDLLSLQDPQRLVDTQAALAREPLVASRTLNALGLKDRTPRDLLDSSSVAAKSGTNLLVFRVTDRDRKLASLLATAYATQFTLYVRELDTGAIKRALSNVERRLDRLSPADSGSPLYASLVDKEQQLQALLTLQTSNASVVRQFDPARQVQPTPVRNGVIGFVLGVLFGIGLAFLRDALDTRVRTTEEISRALGMPLLARIPKPPRSLRTANRLVMLSDSGGPHAEAFRMLRTNLEFVNIDQGARTILITSSVEREGKSTTAANLAVSLARAGKRVVLIDLDLRRPFLHEFFDRETRPGITDVTLGIVPLQEALSTIAVTGSSVAKPAAAELELAGTPASTRRSSQPSQGRNGKDGEVAATFQVLTCGTLPPDPGEFVGTKALGGIIDELAQTNDFVLIDSPPLLRVGDALTLSAGVDAVLCIAQLEVVRRRMLVELRRLFDRCPAVKLGFVLTGAAEEKGYEYGYGRYEQRTQDRRPQEVVR